MVSHLDSLWNRGTRELGNGLLDKVWLKYETMSRGLLVFTTVYRHSRKTLLLNSHELVNRYVFIKSL